MKKASVSVKPLVLVVLFVLTIGLLFAIGAVTGYAVSTTNGITLCTNANFKGECRTLTSSVRVIEDMFGAGITSASIMSSNPKDMYFLCARDQYRYPCRMIQNGAYENLKDLKFKLNGFTCDAGLNTCWWSSEKTFTSDFNDNIRSVIVAPWVMSSANVGSYEPPFPIFCTGEGMTGECLRVKSSYPELDSLKITTDEINLIEGLDKRGQYYYVEYYIKFNDKFTSMIVPSGWTIAVYTNPNYGGKEAVFKGPTYVSDFSTLGLNGKISSILLSTAPQPAQPVQPAAPETPNKPPTLTVTHMPLNPKVGDQVRITAIASDDKLISSVSLYFDNKKLFSCDWKDNLITCSQIIKSVAEGEHSYYAVAKDSDGLTSRVPATAADWKSKSFTIPSSGNAATPPELSVTVTPVSPKLGDTVTIDAVASGVGVENMEISVDGAVVKTCQDFEKGASGDFRCIYSAAFKVGEHTYSVTAKDSNGAWTSYATEGRDVNSFKVLPLGKDAVMPVIEKVYIDPEYIYTNQPFTIVAEASDNAQLSTIEILMDGAKKTCTINAEKGRCTYDFPKGYSSAGTHTYWVYATDASSNLVRDPATGRSPSSYTLEILEPTKIGGEADTTAPTVEVDMKNRNGGKASDCSIDAKATDNRVLRKLEVYINGNLKAYNDFSTVSTGTVSYTENFGWQPGTYKYYGVAYDLYMNKGQTAEKSFTVSDTVNKNCKYVESSCPAGQIMDIKTGVCKTSTTGGGGIMSILGGFVMTATAKIAAVFT